MRYSGFSQGQHSPASPLREPTHLPYGWSHSATYRNTCKNKGTIYGYSDCTSLWNFSPNSGFRKFCHDGRWCCQQNSSTVELVDHTYDGRGWTYIVYYTSVDCNLLTPLLRFVLDLLYDLFIQLCSVWQDFDWHIASRGPSAVAELIVWVKQWVPAIFLLPIPTYMLLLYIWICSHLSDAKPNGIWNISNVFL